MVDSAARAEILANMSDLAARAVDRQYFLQPGVWEKYGKPGREKALEDAKYHFSFLAEAVAAGEPALFLDYVQWLQELFTGLHFPPDALRIALECTLDAIGAVLSPSVISASAALIETALKQVSAPPPDTPSFFTSENPLVEEARKYLLLLLDGQKTAAQDLVDGALHGGASIREIYLQVFQPSQKELGRLWQSNRISVAQEHYCTAATQLIMARLYPRMLDSKKTGKRLVAACVSGELHEIGMRMVADLIEMEGWDAHYAGANTPAAGIVRMVADRRPAILALSATMTFHLGALESIIREVRAGVPGSVKILVGGRALNVAPALWQTVGADGFARDAEGAVVAAALLVGENQEA